MNPTEAQTTKTAYPAGVGFFDGVGTRDIGAFVF